MRAAQCLFDFLYTLDGERRIAGKSVASLRHELAKKFGQRIGVGHSYDYVVPIPNTGLYYAAGVAAGLEVPVLNIFEKDVAERTLGASHELRMDLNSQQISLLRSVNFEVVSNKNILFVDEALISSGTAQIIASKIKFAKASSISFCFIAPLMHSYCPWGIINNTNIRFAGFKCADEIEEECKRLALELNAANIHFGCLDMIAENVKDNIFCDTCFMDVTGG